jgi:hypothetical protein
VLTGGHGAERRTGFALSEIVVARQFSNKRSYLLVAPQTTVEWLDKLANCKAVGLVVAHSCSKLKLVLHSANRRSQYYAPRDRAECPLASRKMQCSGWHARSLVSPDPVATDVDHTDHQRTRRSIYRWAAPSCQWAWDLRIY